MVIRLDFLNSAIGCKVLKYSCSQAVLNSPSNELSQRMDIHTMNLVYIDGGGK